MQFVITGTDKVGALEDRQKARSDHLAYWGGKGAAFLAAGPFLDGDDKPVGSMMIVEVDSQEQANNMAENDPYVLAGVFASFTVRRWNWLLGTRAKKSGE